MPELYIGKLCFLLSNLYFYYKHITNSFIVLANFWGVFDKVVYVLISLSFHYKNPFRLLSY